MQLIIVNESQVSVPRKFIEGWMQDLSKILVQKKIVSRQDLTKELTLVFLTKTAAKKLNKEFRQRDYATDVLSFESISEDSLGELVMCPDVLKKQAQEHGLSYQAELGYMLLHGVLHLLGYDHETSEEDAQEMFSLQDAIFDKLLSLRKKASGK